MAVEFQVFPAKNRLFVRMDGFTRDDEATKAAEDIIAALARLKPGFDVITDISRMKPGSSVGAEQIMRVQQAYKDHGVGRVVRVVGENVLGKMQMQRTAAEVGIDTAYVASLEEAERLLGI